MSIIDQLIKFSENSSIKGRVSLIPVSFGIVQADPDGYIDNWLSSNIARLDQENELQKTLNVYPTDTSSSNIRIRTIENQSSRALTVLNPSGVELSSINVFGQFISPTFFANSNGSASSPVFSRSTDQNTGFFFPDSDLFGVSTGGVERVRFGNNYILTRDSITNSSDKSFRLYCGHYTNNEEPVTMIYTSAQNTSNIVNIGGGVSAGNSATHIRFYTGSDTTTTTGSLVGQITSDGFYILPTFGMSIGDSTGIIAGGIKVGRAGTSEPFLTFANYDGASGLANIRGLNGGGIRITRYDLGVEWLRLSSDGNLAVGTTVVTDRFNINGNILLGASTSTNTQKTGNINSQSYAGTGNNITTIRVVNDGTHNRIAIGGGTSAANAATNFQVILGASTTTAGNTATTVANAYYNGWTFNVPVNATSDITLDSTGGTAESPRSLIISTTLGTYSRIGINGTSNSIQCGNGKRTQINSWFTLDICGDRQTSAPAFISADGSENIGVRIFSSRTASRPLVVQGSVSQSANLTEWRNSADLVLTYVSPGGNFYVPRVLVGAGNASNPSVSFSGDTDTGFFNTNSNNTISIGVGATQIGYFNIDGLTISNVGTNTNGAVRAITTGGWNLVLSNTETGGGIYRFASTHNGFGIGGGRLILTENSSSSAGSVLTIWDGKLGFGVGNTSPQATIHGTGSTILGAAASGVPNANLGNGQVNIWIDSENTLVFKVKTSSGTVKTASLSLS